MLISMQCLGHGANRFFFGGGGRGWSNSQKENRRAGLLRLLELFGSPFNMAKFHPNYRDGMYYPCMVLW